MTATTTRPPGVTVTPMRAEHAAAGFRVVGTRERLGRLTHGPRAGSWLDVVLLEKRL